MEEAKEAIKNLLQEGFDNEYLSKEEYLALDPSDKGAARFLKSTKPTCLGIFPPPDQL